MNKINLIIECLEAWKECHPEPWEGNDELALSYARSLRDMEPVGVFEYDEENKVWEELTPNCEGVKLYSLEQSE